MCEVEGIAVEPISLDVLLASVGKEVGVSPWRVVTQRMIDQFADATDDHQFIHCDPERAKRETPFGGTIAHGFLSLSLLSAMTFETMPPLENGKMGVNHGFDTLRFLAPVQTAHDVTIEIEGSKKPALTARWLTLTLLERQPETA